MNNFYPNGAIKGGENFEKLLDQRFKKGSNLYLVNAMYRVYRIRLDSDTKIHYPSRCQWTVENQTHASSLRLGVSDHGYIQSMISAGYLFNNFWHAWAYANHLEQSGFTVDWCFPIGVG